MDAALRILVRRRADNRCEYCRLPKPLVPWLVFHVEHILPRQHGGADDASNLAWACSRCNAYKGTNLTGIDPATGEVTVLFNPRRQRWSGHFRWRGLTVVGRTSVGRATIAVLRLNNPHRIGIRLELQETGLFPFEEP